MSRRHFGRRLLSISALVVLVAAAAACGYALAGRGNNLPAYIKTIGVPQFVNQSTWPGIDQVLTTKVQEEFQSRGRYRTVPDSAGADAVLTATVISVVPIPAGVNTANQVTRYAIVVTAAVEFRDSKDNNKVLWASPALQGREEYDVTASANPADPTSPFRQDGNALDRLAKDFARRLVSSILEGM